MRARAYVSWNRGRAISIDSRSTYCFRCINLRSDCNPKKKGKENRRKLYTYVNRKREINWKKLMIEE